MNAMLPKLMKLQTKLVSLVEITQVPTSGYNHTQFLFDVTGNGTTLHILKNDSLPH